MPHNELDEFLGNLKDNNEDPFKEAETSEDKTKEEDVEKEEEKEEKPLPFNKDPKIQRFIEKQIEKRLASQGKVEKEFVHDTKPSSDDDDYYARLIGNDTPEKLAMIKEAKARDEKLLAQAEERAFSRLSKAQQEEVQAERKAEEELENALDDIEERFEIDITSNEPVAKKTRVDFLKFVERIAPKDKYGEINEYPDMLEAFETFKEMKAKPSSASKAKDLSSRSMSRGGDTSTTSPKGYSWKDVDKLFDKLG